MSRSVTGSIAVPDVSAAENAEASVGAIFMPQPASPAKSESVRRSAAVFLPFIKITSLTLMHSL